MVDNINPKNDTEDLGNYLQQFTPPVEGIYSDMKQSDI